MTRPPHREPTGDTAVRERARRPAQPLRASWDPLGHDSRPSVPRPPRGPWRRFADAFGWRAWAVPALVVVTIFAVYDATRPEIVPAVAPSAATPASPALPPPASPPSPPVAPPPTPAPTPEVGPAPPANGTFDPALEPGALPEGGAFPATGAGTWHVVPGTTERVGEGSTSSSTYTVEVEDGMDVTVLGGDDAFARLVDDTLDNPKSWTGDGRFALRRIDSGTPTFRITLTAQETVRGSDNCGYSIQLESSCFDRSSGRVLINAARWVRGATSFQGDIGSYRQYVINHEVGHALGFGHQPCGEPDGLAPVMMQQTFSTANNDIAALEPGGVVPADGLACRYNSWPLPRG